MNERFNYVRPVDSETAGVHTETARQRENYIAAMLGCSALSGDNEPAYMVMSQEEIQRAAAARRAIAVEA